MTFTPEEIRQYYANKKAAFDAILRKAAFAKDKQIVHGQSAVNAQVPYYLEKSTSDIDIYTKRPRKAAVEAAEELNKQTGKKIYYVKAGQHKGTFKVKSKIGKETIADYTKQEKEIPTVNKMGVHYASIDYMKKRAKQLVRNPEAKFRRDKDKSILNRVAAFESRWGV